MFFAHLVDESHINHLIIGKGMLELRFAPRGRINETYPNAFSYG